MTRRARRSDDALPGKVDVRDHSVALAVVVMLCRGLRIAIASEPFVAGDLIQVEQRPRFEMRGKVHGAETALQLDNRSRRRREAIRCDFPARKELVKRPFLRDQFAAERLRRRAHAVENRLHVAALSFG
jgi:hypothetical protein